MARRASHHNELGHAQHARCTQVEKLGREHPDLGLNGAKCATAEHKHHTKRRRAKQEDDGCRRHHARQQSPQRDCAKHSRRRRPECAGRLFLARVERLPARPDRAHHHRDIEEHECHQNGDEAAIEWSVAQQGTKSDSDHHRRQHERHDHECSENALPSKTKAVQHVRDRQPERDARHRRDARLREGKPDDAQRAGALRASAKPPRPSAKPSQIMCATGHTKKIATKASGTSAAAAIAGATTALLCLPIRPATSPGSRQCRLGR